MLPFRITWLTPTVPDRLAWGGEQVAIFSVAFGPILIRNLRLIRRPEGDFITNAGGQLGQGRVLFTDPDFAAAVMARARGMLEAVQRAPKRQQAHHG